MYYTENMNKIIILAIIVLAAVGFWLYQRGGVTSEMLLQESESPSASPVPTPTASPEGNGSNASPMPEEPVSNIKTFIVSGQPFSLVPNEIEVNKGDTVRITFKNISGTHDFVIDEFNVRTKVIQTGQEETVEFVADKVGTFVYYCSVGTHRQMGMWGELIVK